MTRFPGSDIPCACTHMQQDHDPDCQVFLGRGGIDVDSDGFCACSSYYAPVKLPRFSAMAAEVRAAARKRLDDKWMPAWTAEARCRSARLGGEGPNNPGQPHPDAYLDDLADSEDLRLPEASVKAFMRDLCAPCPVRETCLAYAYDSVDGQHRRRYGLFGGVPGRIRERMDAEAANEWFLALAEAEGWIEAEDRTEGIEA